ncbi:MAG: DUF1540 domain-containing protein [Ruminococcaceae bacterium]|nr:DUF1540 domain-containing protein [Oscillospiraceae bacterium]
MINMTDCKTESCIDCSVQNCIHHTTDDRCMAGKISIGNRSACSCSETCCDTFVAKH